jgi:glyoxylase-like metal-dependent hydrolase (beta-lactamase superfamily II)
MRDLSQCQLVVCQRYAPLATPPLAFLNSPMRNFAKQAFFVASVIAALDLTSIFAHAAGTDAGQYVSPARTFSTNSFWIAGPSGVVMVDTQFLPKEGIDALNAAEKATGKKVVTAIVLHPNPDKFNGTAAYQARGVQVITSDQVRKQIPAVHEIRLGWFSQEYAPDYPAQAAKPDVFGDKTVTRNIAGVPLTLHVLGRGASAAHVVVQHGDTVYVGDLVNPENHAWLEPGLIDEWLARLSEIAALRPRRVMPGRGKPGGPELLEAQAAYLRFVQAQVRARNPSGSLGTFTKLMLQRRIENEYSKLTYPIFMRDGLEAVWRTESELASKPK